MCQQIEHNVFVSPGEGGYLVEKGLRGRAALMGRDFDPFGISLGPFSV